MTNMTNNKNYKDDIKSIVQPKQSFGPQGSPDYDSVEAVPVPEELLKELENLRTKFKRQKEARVKSIEKNPEKYSTYFKDYHREYYRSKQSKDEKYMEYQRTKALERYYRKKEEKQNQIAQIV